MNIFTIIVLVVIAFLTAAYFLRSKILKIMAAIPMLLFPIFLALALSALFIGGVYKSLAAKSAEKAGILDMIQNTDEKLEKLNVIQRAREESESFLENLKHRFNQDQEAQEEPVRAEDDNEPGYLELNLYPKIIGLITWIYRGMALVLGLVGLGLMVYFGYSTQSINELKHLQSRCAHLEQRIQVLENREQQRFNL
ncbi:MAG: hypothetical protein GF332_02835 [Candidatus Moranbacteria bacterium]|nr:hypothetical protein [Candidatus Moranbacteria bacterium]